MIWYFQTQQVFATVKSRFTWRGPSIQYLPIHFQYPTRRKRVQIRGYIHNRSSEQVPWVVPGIFGTQEIV